ncbi:MAG: hypothetical protein IPI02_13800 [Sterolibacteriaceae bacterium]|nr:hypothetical protein [Sterolibacteriaceae bacterium]
MEKNHTTGPDRWESEIEPKLRFTCGASDHAGVSARDLEADESARREGSMEEDDEGVERDLDRRVRDLCERSQGYRAPPVRRVDILKGPGGEGTRPLGIPTVEDRLLQRAVARILEAVFEADFLECSYGFRLGL